MSATNVRSAARTAGVSRKPASGPLVAGEGRRGPAGREGGRAVTIEVLEDTIAAAGYRLFDVRLPGDYVGLTDYRYRRVFVDERLLAGERRATLAHELAHIERGHFPKAAERSEERTIDRIVAERLVPLDELIEAVKWSDSIEELADMLDVDVPTLTTRLRMLSKAEGARFDRAIPNVGLRRSGPLRRRPKAVKP